MKKIALLNIGLLIITSVVMLCHFLYDNNFQETTMNVIIWALAIGVPLSTGYLLIHLLEKSQVYKWPVAVLMPWLPTFLLLLLCVIFLPDLSYWLMFMGPIMLIASSIGGICAHRRQANVNNNIYGDKYFGNR